MNPKTLRLRLELLNDLCAELEEDLPRARESWLQARVERHQVAEQLAVLLVSSHVH